MERIEELEVISDKIRRGEPVGYLEAIAAINYQGQLRAERDANKWWRRLLRLERRVRHEGQALRHLP